MLSSSVQSTTKYKGFRLSASFRSYLRQIASTLDDLGIVKCVSNILSAIVSVITYQSLIRDGSSCRIIVRSRSFPSSESNRHIGTFGRFIKTFSHRSKELSAAIHWNFRLPSIGTFGCRSLGLSAAC